MNIAVKIVVKEVDPLKWAANNNGPWPENNLTALMVAVRHDIKSTLQHHLSDISIFDELDIKVEVTGR